ncbi:MAG: hypothetical protein M0030_29115 [Actinomycetota bacterium]|nr:hypothetical protein [Actinomycetota bacterium]
MPGIVLAWMVGEGIIVYRSVKSTHAPPMPGQLLATSGVFVLLALLSQAQQARFLAAALAWGFDVAAFMNLFPAVTGGTPKVTATSKTAATAAPQKGVAA